MNVFFFVFFTTTYVHVIDITGIKPLARRNVTQPLIISINSFEILSRLLLLLSAKIFHVETKFRLR